MSPARRRWENRDGWAGILRITILCALVVIAIAAGVAAVTGGPAAAASAAIGGGVVFITSTITLGITAYVSDRHAEHALVLSMGAMLLRLVVYGGLLAFMPRPAWLQPEPAVWAALAVILAWQASEVLVFARTRRGIYD